MSTPDPLSQPRANARTFAIVTVIIAFIAGLLIGVVGDRFYSFRHRDRAGMRGSRFMTQRIVSYFDRQLHLSAQQKEQVTQILEARRQRISAITAAARPQIRREIDEGNAEIEKLLTPEQRVKFNEMKMRMLPRRDRELPPGSTPPRGSLTPSAAEPAPSPAGSQHP